MKKLNIALLAGGNSSERDIALNSAAQVAAAMDHDKYNIVVVDLHHRDWCHAAEDGSTWQVDKNDFSITIGDEHIVFDFALIIIHGTPGENGMLQGYLDMMEVPYSSCSLTSSVITFDKATTKRVVEGRGVNLAKEIFVRKGDVVDSEAIVAELGLPLFVKPNASGSSYGVTKVKSVADVAAAVEAAFEESDEVLIEEFISGREVGCGVMIAGGKEYLLPITEIVSKRDFFDFEAKYSAGAADEITPADLSADVVAKLNKATLEIYKACRCSGVVRIDFIITESGEPYMIEVNSIPGMSSGSIVPKQLRVAGLSTAEMYDIIIQEKCK